MPMAGLKKGTPSSGSHLVRTTQPHTPLTDEAGAAALRIPTAIGP